jgi:Rps23 Pro-64 3,4-dihydroxylase Tpa1-like proline 4-hydroxylase
MLHINPSVYDHLNQYKQDWEQDKIVTIKDLLVEEDADKLNDYVLNVDDSKWNYSLHPYMDGRYIFNNTPENQEHITKGTKSALQCYNNGGFSYNFRRFEGYEQDGIMFRQLLTCKQFTNLIQQITGTQVNDIVSAFMSAYNGNSFLSKHDDNSLGKMAFVYNLTKNWKTENGGLFQLFNEDWHTLKKTVTPTFNSFTFFSILNNKAPHHVTKVNEQVQGKRIAISGWLV